MTTETFKAWHWLSNDRKLGYEDNREVIDGETLSIPPDIMPVLCMQGMHGSIRVIDALKYAPGSVLCRVEISGDVTGQYDKIVGRSRKVLWSITAKQGLELIVAFAKGCAKRAKEYAASAATNAAISAAYYASSATNAAASAANNASYTANAASADAYAAASYTTSAATNAAYYATTAATNSASSAAYYASSAANAAATNAASAAAANEREIQEQWWQTELAKLKPNDITDC